MKKIRHHKKNVTIGNYNDLYTCDIIDNAEKRIGGVGQVYLDNKTNEPSWVTVKMGLFGAKSSFVPLVDATITDAQIVVPYSQEKIGAAPTVDPSHQLSANSEFELYKHYDIDAITAEESASTAIPDVAKPSPESETT